MPYTLVHYYVASLLSVWKSTLCLLNQLFEKHSSSLIGLRFHNLF